MTPVVFGTCMIVLGAIGACSWVGMYLGARGLRKELAAKNTAIGLWKAEAERVGRNLGAAEDKIDKLQCQLALEHAKLRLTQARLLRYDRIRSADGRYEKAAQ